MGRSDLSPGFWISFVKKFQTWPKSPNFAKFGPKFIFRLFKKILLNIFKLLFLKFSNFGGGEITKFREILPKFWTLPLSKEPSRYQIETFFVWLILFFLPNDIYLSLGVKLHFSSLSLVLIFYLEYQMCAKTLYKQMAVLRRCWQPQVRQVSAAVKSGCFLVLQP